MDSRLSRQECVESLFGTVIDEMVDARKCGQAPRPFELVQHRRMGARHSVQFRVTVTIVPDDFTAPDEPIFIIGP